MASIKCGNCEGTHGSAMQVRECYATKGGNTKVGFKSTAPIPAQALTTTKWAKANVDTDWSQGKANFAAREAEQERAAFMAKEDLRSKYETKGTPRVVSAPTDKVPAGRYAILEEGVVKFYRVTHGKEGGRWAGYTFVEAQASDDHWPVKNSARRNTILRAIGADVAAAMALYGMELGKCGHCGRTLTSEWRKKGIGPVCAQKMGFAG